MSWVDDCIEDLVDRQAVDIDDVRDMVHGLARMHDWIVRQAAERILLDLRWADDREAVRDVADQWLPVLEDAEELMDGVACARIAIIVDGLERVLDALNDVEYEQTLYDLENLLRALLGRRETKGDDDDSE